MNLALESLYRVIDDATARTPQIVREPCHWCRGVGAVERPHKYRALMQLERCQVCAGTGRLTVESIDLEPR